MIQREVGRNNRILVLENLIMILKKQVGLRRVSFCRCFMILNRKGWLLMIFNLLGSQMKNSPLFALDVFGAPKCLLLTYLEKCIQEVFLGMVVDLWAHSQILHQIQHIKKYVKEIHLTFRSYKSVLTIL